MEEAVTTEDEFMEQMREVVARSTADMCWDLMSRFTQDQRRITLDLLERCYRAVNGGDYKQDTRWVEAHAEYVRDSTEDETAWATAFRKLEATIRMCMVETEYES